MGATGDVPGQGNMFGRPDELPEPGHFTPVASKRHKVSETKRKAKQNRRKHVIACRCPKCGQLFDREVTL